jgi:uncharacterized protein involved in type VI secretion and phage assembly
VCGCNEQGVTQDHMTELYERMDGQFYGKYRGVVVDNDDPTRRGRIKVRVPAVMGEEEVWALPCAPYGGDNMGLYMIPEADTGVWVEFEAGDPSYPIWVGCFWGDDEVPRNERGTQGTPPLKIIRSQKGLMVTLDDQQEMITVTDENGNNFVRIETQEGKVTVQGTVKVVVEAPLIELVENSTHPVVFGDRLLQYLNQLVMIYQSHTHWPLLSPPTPPFPPATPALLSSRVTTG